jgi:hypothetical protein
MASSIEHLTASPSLQALREQLVSAAATFAGEGQPLGDLLRALVDDVERAASEPLEIFPVKHHSPASALHMLRRLRAKPPKVIFLEMCEDMLPALNGLEHCQFPVALQAFAPEAPAFPPEWSPLNIVAPLTEFSAEYQALAYCREHPETALVFVDRSVDHEFQWMPKAGPPPGTPAAEAEGESEAEGGEQEGEGKDTANLHGGAVGLRVGAMEPTFDEFLEVLLRNARVRHYSEWWSQYVEGPALACDYETYRHVFFLVGSLLRRVGTAPRTRASNEQRERYMWARMRQYLREHKIDPREALHICGAAHAVSPIPEFGTRAEVEWEVPPRTETKWLYGVVPSSHAAIEHQFGLPAGEVALAQRTWEKGLQALGLEPFKLGAPEKKKKVAVRKKAAPKAKGEAAVAGESAAGAQSAVGQALHQFLTRPPALVEEDDEQLLQWYVEIVRLARKHGYMASTADTIAIHHTARLLAHLRDRPHPSPYDFREAAITCLEKDRVPRKRNVERLCDILLGGDRLGRVGYESLPPLAKDVYDRLAVLGVDLKSSRIERALMDLEARPELLPASELLWRLLYLGVPVKPIMGERALGSKPRQESWDIGIGKAQHSVIQLGYEGATVEQVLEKRLKAKVYKEGARTVHALAAVEDSLRFLKSGRLSSELGLRAVLLLREERGASDAPEIFKRIRSLVHYLRTVGLPEWIKEFVSTGYQHFSTLLPQAFTDRGTTPPQLAAMLAFIFTQEALAFSLGCQRSQLLIAMGQAAPEDPPKRALLWAAQWVLGLRGEEEIRGEFTHLLTQPLLLPAFPEYMAGFLLALEFTPRMTRLAVELMSRAFADLPDEVLVPWLPKLVVALRPLGAQVLQVLVKEAGLALPRQGRELAAWQFAWERSQPEPVAPAPEAAEPTLQLSAEESAIAELLRGNPEPLESLAVRLGVQGQWGTAEGPRAEAPATKPAPAAPAADDPVAKLLADYPEALQALSARITV